MKDVRPHINTAGMTLVAYMTREDWAQDGTAMPAQSEAIRAWLGDRPYLFATTDLMQYQDPSSADAEFVAFIAPSMADRHVIEMGDLRRLSRDRAQQSCSVVVVHPTGNRECELMRSLVTAGSVDRVLVIVWSMHDLVRAWLDGVGAVDIHAGAAVKAPDPVQLQAAGCWVREQYNGLSGGNGKSAVVQLLRTFTLAGYALNTDTWLRAFFAAGGNFNEADAIARLIREMKAGTRHRIKARYRPDILDVLRAQASSTAAAATVE